MCLLKSTAKRRACTLVLEDGSKFCGYCFGQEASVAGEVVFQTGMVGYQESLTDPSYRRQILVLTYPMIGNYGVSSDPLKEWAESDRIWVGGLVVGESCNLPSHWSSGQTLDQWLKKEGIPGMEGVDTRALTKIIREKGTMRGKIVLDGEDENSIPLVNPNLSNLVAEVSTKDVTTYNKEGSPRICAIDLGMKMNQVRCLVNRGARVDVRPWDCKIDPNEYDGLFLSNGPGDPKMCEAPISQLKQLMKTSTKPIFGICLGHQLMGVAAGN